MNGRSLVFSSLLVFSACEQKISFQFQAMAPGTPQTAAPSVPPKTPDPIVPRQPPGAVFTYSWQNSAWSNGVCQANQRVQTRSSTCKNNLGTAVANSFCVATKPIQSQLVDDSACKTTYSWVSSPWINDLCQDGKMLQFRSYSCKNSLGAVVANSFCTVSAPVSSQLVEDSSCYLSYAWVTSPWIDGACAASNSRLQQREVTCNNNYGVVSAEAKCAPVSRPPDAQPIIDASCTSSTERTLTIDPSDNRAAIHVFFIIDNSESMGDERTRVLSAVRTFVNKVEAQPDLKTRYTVLSSTAREAIGFNAQTYQRSVSSGWTTFPGAVGNFTINPMLPWGLGQEGLLIYDSPVFPEWNVLDKKYIPDVGKPWQVKTTTLEDSHAVSDFNLNYVWRQAPGSQDKSFSRSWNPRTEIAPPFFNQTYQDRYSPLFGFYLSKTDELKQPVLSPPDNRTTALLGSKFGFEAQWNILPKTHFERTPGVTVDALSEAISQKIVDLGVNGSTDSMGRCVIAQALVANFLSANERPLFVVISDAEDKGTTTSGLSYFVEHDCFSKLSISQEFIEKEIKTENLANYRVFTYGPRLEVLFDADYYPLIDGLAEDERATVSNVLSQKLNQSARYDWEPLLLNGPSLGYPVLPSAGAACSADVLDKITNYAKSIFKVSRDAQRLVIKKCQINNVASVVRRTTDYKYSGAGVDCALPASNLSSLIARARAGIVYQRVEDKASDVCRLQSPHSYTTEFGHVWQTTIQKRLMQHELLGMRTSQNPPTLDSALKMYLLSRYGANGFGITAIYNKPDVSFCSNTGNIGVKYNAFVNSFNVGSVSGEAKGWDICASSYDGALTDLANFATGTLANTFIIQNLQANEDIVLIKIVYASGLEKVLVVDVDYKFSRAGASIKLLAPNALNTGDKLMVTLKASP